MTDQADNFEFDAVLNTLAMDTLTYMTERLKEYKDIPDEEHAYLMLHAAEAVSFNIIMHIAEHTGASPKEIADKTKANLLEALESLLPDAEQPLQH